MSYLVNLKGTISGVNTAAGETVLELDVAALLEGTDYAVGTDLSVPANLDAAVAMPSVTIASYYAGNAAHPIENFQTAGGYDDDWNIITGGRPVGTFTMAVRVKEKHSDNSVVTGPWCKGNRFTVAGPPLVPFHPSFEAADAVAATTKVLWQDEIGATSSARWDGWWGEVMTDDSATTSITSVVDRYASAEMTGSYVGRVVCSGTGAHSYFASMMTRKTKTDIDATNGVITFDIRPKSISTDAYSYASVKVVALDASGNKLITTGTNPDTITLWKGASATAYNGSLLMFAPSVNTTYTKTLDVKTFITGHLDSGKTWSDVSIVILEFIGYIGGASGGANSFYIDNFR